MTTIDILFENRDFIAVDKPHASLSTPSRDGEDPRRCVGREVQILAGQKIFPVHRLDFEVSGILLFAKTAEAHRQSQSWFEHVLVRKTYQALSRPGRGEFAEWQDWRSRLAKGKKRAFEAAHGKEALTRAHTVRQESKEWMWELMPITGRSHQLRFEMAKHGFPILGDLLYGGEDIGLAGWIGLRAVSLDFSSIAERFDLPPVLRAADLRYPSP